jgi:hypothetical protein
LGYAIDKEARMDILKNNLVVGLGVAVAAAVLAPMLIPTAGSAGRPMAKTLVKGGMALYEKAREALAQAGESLEDIMAEIRAEEASASAQAPASADDTSVATYSGNGAQGDGAQTAAAGSVGV